MNVKVEIKLCSTPIKQNYEEMFNAAEYLTNNNECYFQKGRGAIILYPSHIDNVHQLSCIDYNTEDESLDLFQGCYPR
jgi:hypothetical protein